MIMRCRRRGSDDGSLPVLRNLTVANCKRAAASQRRRRRWRDDTEADIAIVEGRH